MNARSSLSIVALVTVTSAPAYAQLGLSVRGGATAKSRRSVQIGWQASGLAARGERARLVGDEAVSDEASAATPATHAQAAAFGYWGPAWYLRPSSPHKVYPPPVAVEPRLGLSYNYPYAYQMGLQVPIDPDPIRTYSLGPFRGVVRSPQTPAWLYGGDEAAVPNAAADHGLSEAVGLLRESEYRAAGLLLAEGYGETDDLRYPLYLVEALLALGKTRHADALFRATLEKEGVEHALPRDVPSHFASKEEFDKVRDQAAGSPLLASYLGLFADEPSEALDALLDAQEEQPGGAAAMLYRHYLHRGFLGESSEEDAEDAPPEQPADGAEADAGDDAGVGDGGL